MNESEQYIEKVKQAIRGQTLIHNAELEPPITDIGLSTKAQQILALKDNFGCYRDAVMELVSILLGEEFPKSSKTLLSSLPILAFVKLVLNPNSHSYYQGELALVIQGDPENAENSHALQPQEGRTFQTGSLGNYLPSQKNAYAAATVEEVDVVLNDNNAMKRIVEEIEMHRKYYTAYRDLGLVPVNEQEED